MFNEYLVHTLGVENSNDSWIEYVNEKCDIFGALSKRHSQRVPDFKKFSSTFANEGNKIHFLKPGRLQRLTEFVKEENVKDRLEAIKFSCIENATPFLKAPIDRLCGITRAGEITLVFTEYLDMSASLFKSCVLWTRYWLSIASEN